MAIKFGTSGWRALLDKDFNRENVLKVITGIGDYLLSENGKAVLIGYDGRSMAKEYACLAADLLTSKGFKTFLVDKVCPTPVISWSTFDKDVDGGIMFTASHNDKEYLGIEFLTAQGMAAPLEATEKIQQAVELAEPQENFLAKKELLEIFDPKPSYFAKINANFDLSEIKQTKLKILIDTMHGSGGGYLKELLSDGKIEISELHEEVRSDFGNLHPDPSVAENIKDLIGQMKNGSFDIGFACDGDADRVAVIDKNGEIIKSGDVLLLIAYYLYNFKNKKGPVVRTVATSHTVDYLAAEFNSQAIEAKVGFKYVGEEMQKNQAIVGGEESGGICINGFVFNKDAQIASLAILDLLALSKKSLNELLSQIKAEIKIDFDFLRSDVSFSYDDYDEIKSEVTGKLQNNPPKQILGKEIIKTRTDDGIKLYFDDGSWLLMRFSGTEPVMRIYAEAKTKEEVQELLAFAKKYST